MLRVANLDMNHAKKHCTFSSQKIRTLKLWKKCIGQNSLRPKAGYNYSFILFQNIKGCVIVISLQCLTLCLFLFVFDVG